MATIVVAAWVAGKIAERQERDTVDTRLTAYVRVGRAQFADDLAAAEARARELAARRDVQRALAEGDTEAAAQIVGQNGTVGLVADDELLAGKDDWRASRAAAVVDEDGDQVGEVVVGVPLNGDLAAALRQAADPVEGDVVAIADDGSIVAAAPGLPEGDAVPAAEAGEVDRGSAPYRFVSTPLVEDTDVRLIALASAEPIRDAAADTRRRAFLAALATVALALIVVLTVSRLLRLREDRTAAVEEGEQHRRARDTRQGATDEDRVREAVALVGEALAATHDPEALLPVILQSAIEATGAAGARLVSGGTEVVRAGRPDEGGRPLALRLGTDVDGIGRLLLYPPRDGSFDAESEQLAHWLAAQASIAIENERLHRTVKRQAITDELTQLANRRRFTETLAVEVRRAERFAEPLALVLADLDDFKQINDRYGHQAGDEVLRRFADVLRENVRDFDLPVRYGGEEFAVLLPETGLDGGELLARRLQTALLRLRLPEIGGDRPPVTASFGVAAFPAAGNAEELLSAADGALYRAKEAGKNRVTLAGDSIRRRG